MVLGWWRICRPGWRRSRLVRCRLVLAGCRRGLGLGLGVGLGDEFDVEDEVGLGGDDGRRAAVAVGELVGDEEAALAADVHAVEAGVPAGDDLVRRRRGR